VWHYKLITDGTVVSQNVIIITTLTDQDVFTDASQASAENSSVQLAIYNAEHPASVA